MDFFWYDHLSEESGCARPLLTGFERFLDILGRPAARRTLLPSGDAENAVYFVHAGDMPDKSQLDWEDRSSIERKVFMVFVSSEPEGLFCFGDATYSVKCALPVVSDLLTAEPDRVDRLLRSCDSGSPDFSLLEKTFPEALVSYFLLAVVHGRTKCPVISEEMSGLVAFAERELKEFDLDGGPGITECDDITWLKAQLEPCIDKANLWFGSNEIRVRHRALRHDYINRFIAMTEEDIVGRWEIGSWQGLEVGFNSLIAEVPTLFQKLIHEISPRHCLDNLNPLGSIPEDVRGTATKVLYEEFDQSPKIRAAQEVITDRALRLKSVLDGFLVEFRKPFLPDSDDQAKLLLAWRAFRLELLEFRGIIQQIPLRQALPEVD